MKKKLDITVIFTIILLFIITLTGIISMNFGYKWNFQNQYGQNVELYGYGIYSYDTYFKAPINIGADFTMLFVVLPLLIYSYIKFYRNPNNSTLMKMASIYGVITYYTASICLGVVYNQLFLIYVLAFSISLFKTIWYTKDIHLKEGIKLSRGLSIFLILCGISLFVAWLPDIISSLISGETLPQIGVYTTEITYVLDMGIVSPLFFLSLYLIKNKNVLGTVILDMMLNMCIVVGIMVIMQTICQELSGVALPFTAMVSKVLIFVIMAIFAIYYRIKIYKEIQ